MAGLAALILLSGCDTRDVSIQVELAGLREKIRKAEAERDVAAKDKATAEQNLERGSLLSIASLKEGLGKAMKSLDQNAIAAFPGYRPAPVKAGRIFYVYELTDPYRCALELNLVPISGSALTPELPKITVEVRAGSDGVWQVPGLATLRELQAAAVAKAGADRLALRRNSPSPSHKNARSRFPRSLWHNLRRSPAGRFARLTGGIKKTAETPGSRHRTSPRPRNRSRLATPRVQTRPTRSASTTSPPRPYQFL